MYSTLHLRHAGMKIYLLNIENKITFSYHVFFKNVFRLIGGMCTSPPKFKT